MTDMIYKTLVRPTRFMMGPENAHKLALQALARLGKTYSARMLVKRFYTVENLRLSQKLFDHTFPNPVGLAAGADLRGDAAGHWHAGLRGIEHLGQIFGRQRRVERDVRRPLLGRGQPRLGRRRRAERHLTRLHRRRHLGEPGHGRRAVRNRCRRLELGRLLTLDNPFALSFVEGRSLGCCILRLRYASLRMTSFISSAHLSHENLFTFSYPLFIISSLKFLSEIRL